MSPVELGSVLFGLAMALLVAGYVLRPLGSRGQGRQAGRQISSLQAEREHLLDALQELDLDHYMGKVLDKDYRPQREALALQGAHVLRRIDEFQGSSEAQVSTEAELEAAVKNLRTLARKDARFCHQCGSRVLQLDQFCSHCGAAQQEPGV